MTLSGVPEKGTAVAAARSVQDSEVAPSLVQARIRAANGCAGRILLPNCCDMTGASTTGPHVKRNIAPKRLQAPLCCSVDATRTTGSFLFCRGRTVYTHEFPTIRLPQWGPQAAMAGGHVRECPLPSNNKPSQA